MDRCDQIRLVRRHRDSAGNRSAIVKGVDLELVAKALEEAWEKPEGAHSADGLRTKLHVLTLVVCEAFFAGAAILTEGEGDIAALKAAAVLNNHDLEEINCALIPCGGKGNIDKVLAILRQLEIPTYVIWDMDNSHKFPAANVALLRMHGKDSAEDQVSATRVETNFACHADKLETTLKTDLGDAYGRLLDEVRVEFGVKSGEADKSPLVMHEIVTRAAAAGLRSATLDGMVSAIWQRFAPQPAVTAENPAISVVEVPQIVAAQ